MTWQDLVFAAGQFLFAVALIPALSSAGKPPRSTCILTGTVLLAFTFAFASLGFLWSTSTSFVCAALWLALAIRRRA